MGQPSNDGSLLISHAPLVQYDGSRTVRVYLKQGSHRPRLSFSEPPAALNAEGERILAKQYLYAFTIR
jgi:hypothetical protein